MPTLHFKGKTFVQNHHLAVEHHELVPKKKLSLTDKVSLHDNLIVHGDNLRALKALLPTYGGRVKCIYIDPPYNTGNESWVYNDKVNSPMIREWLGNVVDKEDLTRHDKWLCMIMPRLKLLRELLREDGVIFISCDDNEQHNLRVLLDEVFGEQNFIAVLGWQKKFSRQSDAKFFSDTFEHINVYCKNIEYFKLNLLPRTEKQDSRYKNPDSDLRGVWSPDNMVVKTYSAEYDYPITTPTGRVVNPARGFCWRFSKRKFQELVEDNRIWFGATGNNIPRLKRFLSEVQEGLVPMTLWLRDFAGDTQEAVREVKEILTEQKFDSPKPSKLIKQIIHLTTDRDAIVLDSFAGSGTTAQAVLELNKEDGGNRKFILVEMEEYANTITAERVRRVIKGVKSSKSEKLREGLGGTFSYFELGKAIEMESILGGGNLPSYVEFARYLFFTATGEQFDPAQVNEETHFIGESRNYEVYLVYKPDLNFLKTTAITLDFVKEFGKKHHERLKAKNKMAVLFAPAKYVDDHSLRERRIEFEQLPYEIYRMTK